MLQQRTIHVFINRKKFELTDPVQTGRSLKELAGIPLGDVLFLQQPHEDQVIANDSHVTLKNGDQLHSSPPADYGHLSQAQLCEAVGPQRAEVLPQPDGWVFLVVHDYALPSGYQPNVVRLLVKLPPLFPEAQPDMFWTSPHVHTASGAAPKGTCTETLLDEPWQRFSWHLAAGAWRPGTSDLRDFLRCIRARLERRD